MNAKSQHPSAHNNDSATRPPLDDVIPARDASAEPAGRACCCPAKAMVRVVMPPTPARPHETDLLLCGHHYRVSQPALAAARARVREVLGTSADTEAWIRFGSYAAAAQPG
jgi:hypothetical protein